MDVQPRLPGEASNASLAVMLTSILPYDSAVEAAIPLAFLVCVLFGDFLMTLITFNQRLVMWNHLMKVPPKERRGVK